MSIATSTAVSIGIAAAGVGGSIVSGAMQSSAAKDAASTQKQSTDAGLAYEKERDAYARSTEANRYGAMTTQLAPYRAAGTGAETRLAGLLRLPASVPRGTSSPAAPTAARMVMLRAPDGSTKAVPAAHVDRYVHAGATRLA